MLRKLMKHEFRATGRVMLPLFLVVLVTAVGANLSTRGLLEMENGFLNILGMLLMVAFVLAIVGVCIVAFVLMIERFHKNLLQDEGYLMMTLPASVHQHVWSKVLVSTVWYIATAAVVILAFCVLAFDIDFVGEFFRMLAGLLKELHFDGYIAHGVSFGLELLALMFLSCVGACLQIYAAMAIGHSFVNHKVLLSVVFYFGIQFALQLLGGGFVTLVDATGLDYVLTQALPDLSGIAAMHLGMAVLIVAAVLFAGLFYILTTFFLKKRLNLE